MTLAAQAVFGRGLQLDEIDREVSQNRQVFCLSRDTGTIQIVMERHIQHPVQAVFDAPMLADRMGKALHIGLEARDEEMNLGGGAIADCARALYDADGAEIPPASIAVEIFDLRRIRDEDMPALLQSSVSLVVRDQRFVLDAAKAIRSASSTVRATSP